MIESLILMLSYPLRLMATFGAVGVLKLLGVAVSADRTLITVESDGLGIAVTDACSGIEQLLALVFLGAVIAGMMQRSWLLRLTHWACILPAIVLANTLRLVVTVLLYLGLGEVVLGDLWHHGLGYAQSVLALVFLWLFGLGLRLAGEPEVEVRKESRQ